MHGETSPGEFENRHIVVTGGTGALGSAVVDALLRAGARCIVPWIADREVEAFAHRNHERVTLVGPVDLAREDQVASCYTSVERLWASIHIAGGFAMSALADTSLDDWRRMLDMNATTCFLCAREAVKRIRQSGDGGRIVNVAARPALEPAQGAGMAAYTVSKAAVAALTQALGAELAGENILVNAIAPSIMDTPANRAGMPDANHDAWPKLDEVAATIVFLASPQNKVTRGGIVPVYGKC
jgi:NAD(P)-dependent dehydrogenase (short-subunit alcohol dehydrogenase family)